MRLSTLIARIENKTAALALRTKPVARSAANKAVETTAIAAELVCAKCVAYLAKHA